MAPSICGRSNSLLQRHADGCSLPDLTGQLDAAAMQFDDMLDNRKSESGSAGFSGSALVYAIEALKDAVLLLSGYADAGVGNNQLDLHSARVDADAYRAVLYVVADRILNQVINQLDHETLVGGDKAAFA